MRADGTFALSCLDHRERDAVLGRAGRVRALELDEHTRLEAVRALDVAELQQRGVADQLVDGGIDLAHGKLLIKEGCVWCCAAPLRRRVM